MSKEELAEEVHRILWDHNVVIQISHDWGTEEVPYCFSCGYLGDQEDPSLHAELVMLEYVEGYYEERFSNERNAG